MFQVLIQTLRTKFRMLKSKNDINEGRVQI